MRVKITACTGSWDELWAIRYKRPKPNCHFWGTQSKSNVLHMIPAHSTIKGVGRHLSHLFSPTHWSASIFAPFKELAYPPPQPPVSEQGHVLVVSTPKSKCTLLITWQSNISETMCWGKKYNFLESYLIKKMADYCLKITILFGPECQFLLKNTEKEKVRK